MSFEEHVGLMVDAKWAARQNSRLARFIRNAGFAIPEACLEDVEYHPYLELDEILITRLGTCNFIDEHHIIIVMGATGGGKTYLAKAFGIAAPRKLHSVRYARLPDLLGELGIAEAQYKRASTTFCAQFDAVGWHQKIGEPTLADAALPAFHHLRRQRRPMTRLLASSMPGAS